MSGIKKINGFKDSTIVKKISLIPPLISLLFLPDAVYGQALYKYIDKNGTIHYVDDPMLIPPEYANKKEEVKPETGVNLNFERGSSQPRYESEEEDGTPTSPQGEDSEENQRKAWQKKAYCAKKTLEFLKARETELDEQLKALNMQVNTLGSIGSMQDFASFSGVMEALKQRIKAQEDYVKSGLFEEARRAGVPTGWLRDSGWNYKCEELEAAQTAMEKAKLPQADFAPSDDKRKEKKSETTTSPSNLLSPKDYHRKKGKSGRK
ncbi:MAG: hypothetical protein Kow0090_17970 [Myxococcota bacterium]